MFDVKVNMCYTDSVVGRDEKGGAFSINNGK
jgi:hypothetical protein